MVVLAFVISAVTGDGRPSGGSSDGPQAALSYAAPPNYATQADACTKVLAQLPVTLDGLDPRVVHTTPETPFVVAWGDPPIVLRCGAARPADLHPDSGALFVAGGAVPGPVYDVTHEGDANVWTTVDRAAYVSITVPKKYQSGPLPALSRAIQQALPRAVCSTEPTDPVATLCTRRP